MNPSYNPTATNGVFPFSEPVLTTYRDLDRLIAKAGLTPSENKVVNWLMQGYIEADIADHCGIARQAVVAGRVAVQVAVVEASAGNPGAYHP